MARHEWRAHPFKLAFRHAAGQHQRLGAATERAKQRAHAHFVRSGRGEGFLADFGLSGPDIPERLGNVVDPADRQILYSLVPPI